MDLFYVLFINFLKHQIIRGVFDFQWRDRNLKDEQRYYGFGTEGE